MGQPFVSIRYHFVWSTQGRRPWLTLALMPDVLACLRSKCSELGVISLAVGGVEDHVHVLVGAPASLSPSVIVGAITWPPAAAMAASVAAESAVAR